MMPFTQLFSSDFMPHGACYLWESHILWLHVIADSLIAFSYYCIPIILIYFIRKNRGLPFNSIFWMFGSFILACGTTHVLEVWNVWHGDYLLAGIMKAVTAAISVLTTGMLIPLVPKVMSLPERAHLQNVNRDLERQIQQHKRFDDPVDVPAKRRIASGLVLALVLTAVTGISAWHSAARAAEDAFWVSHTYEVREVIQRTTRHAIQVETTARAFALSGEEQLLLHYEEARHDTLNDQQILRRLTADNQSQQQRLDILEVQIQAAIEFANSIIARRRQLGAYPGGADALEIERHLETVRSTSQALYEEESRLLIQRVERAGRGQFLTRLIAIVGALLAAGFWLLAWLAVNREIGVSARARSQLNTLNAELEKRVEQRTEDLQREILKRTRAQENAERLAAVVESSDDAIISKTLQGVITAWNTGAKKVFGYTADEAIGKPMSMLIPPDRVGEEATILNRIGHGVSVEHFETVRMKKDGTLIDVSVTISPIRDNTGRVMGASKVARDITERKRAETARHESDLKFHMLVNVVPQFVWICTPDGFNVYFNDRWFEYTGLTLEETHGFGWNTPFHPDDRQTSAEAWKRSAATGETYTVESRLRAADGSYRWFLMLGEPLRNAVGTIIQWFGTCTDIEDMKRAQAALRQSEERFQILANTIPQLVWMAEPNGDIFWYNQRWYDFTGTTFEQMSGWGWQSVHDPEVLPKVMEGWKRAIANGHPFEMEFPLRGADGRFANFLTRVVPLTDSNARIVRWFGTNTDITELKQTQDKLSEHSKVLDLAQVMVRDMDSRIVLWSSGAEKLCGFQRDEALGKISHKLLQTQFPEPVEEIEEKLIRDGSWEGELIHRKRDGSTVTVVSVWVLHHDSHGKPLRILESLTDITARKEAREKLIVLAQELSQQATELARSREALETQSRLLQSVLNSMGEGLLAADRQGELILSNPAAIELLGEGVASVPPDQWSDYYRVCQGDGKTLLPREEFPLARAIRGEINNTELFLTRPGPEPEVWVEVSAGPLKDKDGELRGGVMAIRDVTQRKSAEREIKKLNDELEQRVIERTAQLQIANQELESFSYSVSHDLRAPLRHIGGFSKMLVEEYGASLDPGAKHYLDRIQAGTHKMGLLIDELLNLARVGRHALNRQPTKLNPIIADIISILEADFEGRHVDWVIEDLPPVSCDPVLVKQIFQNLLANALKFTRGREQARIEVTHRLREEDGQLVFMVRDNGVGFSMKYVDKLFGVFQRLHRPEDFEGTGIGLATVQRIVLKHGGRVWAEGEIDKGAAFQFTLEVATKTEAKVQQAVAGGNV